jgi:hypothetical protein
MQIAKVISAIGFLAMLGATFYAAVVGHFGPESALLGTMPLAQAVLVDLYLGLILFAVWIAYREQRWQRALPWIVALMVLGNLVTCAYIFWALHTSGGSWQKVFMGQRA